MFAPHANFPQHGRCITVVFLLFLVTQRVGRLFLRIDHAIGIACQRRPFSVLHQFHTVLYQLLAHWRFRAQMGRVSYVLFCCRFAFTACASGYGCIFTAKYNNCYVFKMRNILQKKNLFRIDKHSFPCIFGLFHSAYLLLFLRSWPSYFKCERLLKWEEPWMIW